MRRRVLVACALLLVCTAPASAVSFARADTPPHMRAIVREWSKRLNAGDDRGIAKLFSLPAIVIQGSTEFRIPTAAGVALWHSGLPCSGQILSIAVHGRYATAVFVLGSDRPGKKCDAPGAKAAARFEIVKGKIRSWQQVPVPAGGPPA